MRDVFSSYCCSSECGWHDFLFVFSRSVIDIWKSCRAAPPIKRSHLNIKKDSRFTRPGALEDAYSIYNTRRVLSGVLFHDLDFIIIHLHNIARNVLCVTLNKLWDKNRSISKFPASICIDEMFNCVWRYVCESAARAHQKHFWRFISLDVA